MHFNAKKYTGVDVQRAFVNRGNKFATQAGFPTDRFQLVCSGVRNFLVSLPADSYDVVVCAGLLHCFVDPQTIVCEVGRVARVAVVVENNYPSLVRRSIVPERSDFYLVQLSPYSLVNYAGGKHSLQGLGATISLETIAILLRSAHAFSTVQQVRLATLSPLPGVSGHASGTPASIAEASAVYDHIAKGQSTPRRFFARFLKDSQSCSSPQACQRENTTVTCMLSTLEQGLSFSNSTNADCGNIEVVLWNGAADRCVTNHCPQQAAQNEIKERAQEISVACAAVAYPKHNQLSRYYAQKHDVTGGWVFDKNVAVSFSSEASLNIPSYVCLPLLRVHVN
jgi:hypothetical protein